METELSSRYSAKEIESKWYVAWEEAGLFTAPVPAEGEHYTLSIPPPNITGALHMGHSLCYPIQDLLGRYHRLRGKSVLIVPGQDHAGIATQSVVSKQLRAQGIQPAELGREKFVEKTWEWRQESGDTILKQFRLLGCAFDWSKSRFTLDDDYVQAVLKVFIDWYERGIIYRGKRIVNWDPVLKTSVSDIETLREDVNAKLYRVRYPFADGSGEVVVATTRPETMLGDVAVAVHPSDKRYEGLVGKTLILPLVGREIPLIADLYPDPEFGTGAVKITPAHDPNDYEVGVRHSLPMPVVLDEDAKVCCPGPYDGLDRYEARKRIVAELEEQGLLVAIEDHKMAIIKSDRSGAVVEPLLSEQWFARQSELAGPAAEAVKSGQIRFTPDRYAKVYTDWLENIRDWNISRQLWWGHRVPVYYTESGEPFAALSWEDAQAKAGDQKIVRQDEDVLDTWFSSGLWPFAVLGWPQKDPNATKRYPTSVLVTDRNIIYLWVARMAMMSLDLLGQIPFRDVYIHATVLTHDGKRMSKSLGTGVDPTEVIEQHGADSLRYTLLGQAGMNQEIRYSEKRVEDARNFCNKIWNATRFFLMNVGEEPLNRPDSLDVVDQWILSRLAATEQTVREAYEGYDMQAAADAVYSFFWSEVCDWYIEISKSRLQGGEGAAACRWTLLQCFANTMVMLHPIMPFITEEIYSHLPLTEKAPFLMASRWPEGLEEFRHPEAEKKVDRWINWVRAIRALRAELEITPKKAVEAVYFEGDLEGGEAVIQSQAWISELRAGKPGGRSAGTALEGAEFFIPSDGLVDCEKLRAEASKLELELKKIQARLDNPEFMAKAKPEVLEKTQSEAKDLGDRIASLKRRMAENGC